MCLLEIFMADFNSLSELVDCVKSDELVLITDEVENIASQICSFDREPIDWINKNTLSVDFVKLPESSDFNFMKDMYAKNLVAALYYAYNEDLGELTRAMRSYKNAGSWSMHIASLKIDGIGKPSWALRAAITNMRSASLAEEISNGTNSLPLQLNSFSSHVYCADYMMTLMSYIRRRSLQDYNGWNYDKLKKHASNSIKKAKEIYSKGIVSEMHIIKTYDHMLSYSRKFNFE